MSYYFLLSSTQCVYLLGVCACNTDSHFSGKSLPQKIVLQSLEEAKDFREKWPDLSVCKWSLQRDFSEPWRVHVVICLPIPPKSSPRPHLAPERPVEPWNEVFAFFLHPEMLHVYPFMNGLFSVLEFIKPFFFCSSYCLEFQSNTWRYPLGCLISQ